MALKLAKKFQNGFIAEYWRISKIVKNKNEGTAQFYLDLYKDKATRDEDLQAIASQDQVVKPLEVLTSGDDFADGYNAIKTEPEWEGSEDI